jgi:hypothetical protein
VRINFLGIVYLVIGAVIAGTHNYFENVDTAKDVISAVLALILWPLVLRGVNLHIH